MFVYFALLVSTRPSRFRGAQRRPFWSFLLAQGVQLLVSRVLLFWFGGVGSFVQLLVVFLCPPCSADCSVYAFRGELVVPFY